MFSSEDIPNRFDYAAAQPRILKQWDAGRYSHSEPDPTRRPFTIVIPPPNVTGALHLGHALNNTLQDVLIRMKRMQGYNALWMPGTDHAGIATQAVVERRLRQEENKTRHDLGREKLVERIWAWKDQYETRILGQLKSMGASCDWERTRFTLDPVCARAVRTTFFDLFSKELIYRGKRLVNWDTFLQTAVSDDEVVHETIQGNFWNFRYPVISPEPGEPAFVTIATTRPETMLGDTAVAVHPDPAGALDKLEADLQARLAKAPSKEKPELQQQLEQLQARRHSHLPLLITLAKMAKAGRNVMLPLMEREIPLIADDWAKPELGTGCVKITPAHDPNDYNVGLRQNLPMINILNPDGTLNSNAGPYQGLTIRDARAKVVADLDSLGLLGQIEDREIELAHSDRSKTPIEPYLADQWFVKMDELAQSAMDAVSDGRVEIIPSRYAKGYLDWLSEKRDWPVSRQLWWGHRIPIWSKLCHTQSELDALTATVANDPDVKSGLACYQVEPDLERATAEAHGGTVHGATKVNLPFGTIHVCIDADEDRLAAKFEALGFTREEDVLDTWFSSALWPHSTLGWPEQTPELAYYYPTDVLITSRDIITLWVARMVLTGLNNMGDVPFRKVFIHPKILDGYGETMSKSKGNGVDPLDVIDKFGADALRYGLAFLCTETQDVRLPVQFECPHCHALMDQTKKNRELPRVACAKCGKEFSTQWASKPEDVALPRGAAVSERFEVSRNFANKLWNAARFTLLNLNGYTPGEVPAAEMFTEDRWVLSRLSTVTQETTEAIEAFRYADAARAIYDFAWDEFCSFYLEIVKARLSDEKQRPAVQRMLAHVLDSLLRLLHPMMPFITEEVWQLLAKIAPTRGLPEAKPATESVMIAPWPVADKSQQNPEIESQFAKYQATLKALNEIRNRQNIATRIAVSFCVRCSEEDAALLAPMSPYFQQMTNAQATAWGPDAAAPSVSAAANLPGLDVYVDLRGLIDVEKEIERNEKEAHKLQGLIVAKEKKLSNASFVDRAPADVVEKERESVKQLQDQLQAVQAALGDLRAMQA
jgi:valyl-tRNA synthetase